ncbi:ANM_collapsed_G0054120.mRNA.1.CDS.1 [Saccharomyces cerevisiae]|nr:ANM_collapsed_G0054120.mRNA.1.CDS.1 [Saccharomyces cerevisiae]
MKLMFNQPLPTSPSKRFSSLSLTPYGRKILNDVGTPYAKALISSNRQRNKQDIYGSSPTTIQLNSSITKSISKLDNSRIPVLTSRSDNILDSNVDDQLFDLGLTRLPLSPTPNCNSLHSTTTGTSALQILSYPRWGLLEVIRESIQFQVQTQFLLKSKSGNNNSKGRIKKMGRNLPNFKLLWQILINLTRIHHCHLYHHH